MKRFILCLAAAAVVLSTLAGCAGLMRLGRGPVEAFTFQAGANPGLSVDVSGAIQTQADPKEVYLVVPVGTDMHRLVATISLSKEAEIAVVSSGKKVVQQNGVTPNDFTVPVTYSITVAGEKLSWEYRVFVREAETNARLSAIIGPKGSVLQPAFSPAVHEYSLEVPFATRQVRIEAQGAARTMRSVAVDTEESPGFNGAAVIDFADVQERQVVIRTLAEDGVTRDRYTVTVTRGKPDSNSSLAALAIGDVPLVPAFSSTQYSYRTIVPYETDRLAVKARPQSAVAVVDISASVVGSRGTSAAVSVAGNPASSAGASVDFTAGDSLTVVVQVTAEDQSIRQYMVEVLRAAPDSNNLLIDLSVSVEGTRASLTPQFAPYTLAYRAEVPYSTRQVTVFARTQSARAVISAIEPVLAPGTRGFMVVGNPQSSSGATIDFAGGSSQVTLVISIQAQDRSIQRYTLRILRAQPDRDASLGLLTASVGALTPPFAPGVVSYTLAIPASAESVSLRAQAASPNASVAILEKPDLKPAASLQFTVSADPGGAYPVSFAVTAEDGSQRLYRLLVKREGPPAPPPPTQDGNAYLQSLSVAGSVLSPAFDPVVIAYEAKIPAEAEAVMVTAAAQSRLAVVTMDGHAAEKGSWAVAVPAGGSKTVSIEVKAQNGTVIRYTLRLTREAAPPPPPQDGNALLKSLTVSDALLQPAFSPSIVLYSVKVPENVRSFTLTALPQSPLAVISMDGQQRTGMRIQWQTNEPRTIFVDVRAQNGTQVRYTLRLEAEETPEPPVTPPPADAGKDRVSVRARNLGLEQREASALQTAGDSVGSQARITVRYYRTSQVITQYTVPVDVKQQAGVPAVTLSYRSNGLTLERGRLVEVETAIPTAKGKYLFYTEAADADAEVEMEVPFLLYGSDPRVQWPDVGRLVKVAGYVSKLPLSRERASDREEFEKNARGDYTIRVELYDEGSGVFLGMDTLSIKPGQGRSRTVDFGHDFLIAEGTTVKCVLTASAKNGKTWSASDTTQVWTTKMDYPSGFEPVLIFISDDLAPEK